MRKGKTILLIGIMIIFLIYIPTISNAALQANGKSLKRDSLPNWMLNIRKMEEIGGTLGLSDTINSTDLTSSASTSNNLDIHMELNTEYGAMALLSASSYGKPNKINDGETTTGNKSGVYISFNREWVVAGDKNAFNDININLNAKYRNIYTRDESSKKIGDALAETKGWYGSNSSWPSGYYQLTALLVRCIENGGIFSYYGNVSDNNVFNRHMYSEYPTRAVVVIGEGL